jgi:formylglycine-generating enzyme required for sulfatase activity
MSEPFDPYYQWLGIPTDQQPPDHYRLLGIQRFESDANIIRAAAEQRFVYLRTFQLSPQVDLSERLLNEIAAAKVCLLDPKAKTIYDATLPPGRAARSKPTPPIPASAPPAPDWLEELGIASTIPTPIEAARPVLLPLNRRLRLQFRKRKATWLAAAAGALLLLAAIGLVILPAGRGSYEVAPVADNLAPPKPRPAVYAVTVDPPGAQVTVAGKGASIDGSGALRTITVAEPDGQTKVLVIATLVGYEQQEQEIQPKPGQQGRLPLQLKSATATYMVTVDPPNAQLKATGEGVRIEGSGASRTVTVRQPDGQAKLRLTASLEGYESREQELQPKLGWVERVTLRLRPSPKPTSPPAITHSSAENAEQRAEAPARHVDLSPEIINSIRMKLVLIRAGEFMMGSPPDEKERNSNEGPQHRVRITRPFYLGAHEVTQWEYEIVMGANPSSFKAPTHPVENVSWDDAVMFCQKLSALPKEKAAKRQYCLPTEAQWEYACRAGTTTAFAFGDTLSPTDANFAGGSHRTGRRNRGPASEGTTLVGSYRANAWGLYDMHGNVWEWCADWYDSGYYGNSLVEDPTGPVGGSNRVFRGGGWLFIAWYCRSAYRIYFSPGARIDYLGFRVSLVAE